MVFRPMGVYTMENKALRQAQEMQIREAFKGAPWANDKAFFDSAFQNMGVDPEKFKYTEQEIMQQQAMQIQPLMGQGAEMGIPTVDTTGATMEPIQEGPGMLPPPMR
jgi:hypothetical protein